jgi:hypothetical protein
MLLYLLNKKVLSTTENGYLAVPIEPYLVLSTEGSTWNQKEFSYGDSGRILL